MNMLHLADRDSQSSRARTDNAVSDLFRCGNKTYSNKTGIAGTQHALISTDQQMHFRIYISLCLDKSCTSLIQTYHGNVYAEISESVCIYNGLWILSAAIIYECGAGDISRIVCHTNFSLTIDCSLTYRQSLRCGVDSYPTTGTTGGRGDGEGQ